MLTKHKNALGGKLMILVVIIALLISVTNVAIGYNIFHNKLLTSYKERDKNLTASISAILDGDVIESYIKAGKQYLADHREELEAENAAEVQKLKQQAADEGRDPDTVEPPHILPKNPPSDEYAWLVQNLFNKMQENNEITYLYILVPDGSLRRDYYIFDTEGNVDGNAVPALPYMDYIEWRFDYDEYKQSYDDAAAFGNVEPVIYTEYSDSDASSKTYLVTMSKIYNSAGEPIAYVGVDRYFNGIIAEGLDYLQALTLTASGVSAVSIAVYLIIINIIIVKPLNDIAAAADAWALRDSRGGGKEYTLPEAELPHISVKSGGTFGTLANTMNSMSQKINKTVLELKIDPLTLLYNRPAFDTALTACFDDYLQIGTEFSLMIIDIDKLSEANEAYGHIFGDEILKGCAKVLSGLLQSNENSAFRYGGEEFAVLVRANEETAMIAAEKLRRTFSQLTFNVGDSKLSFTVSIGVCEVFDEANSEREVVILAEKALYRAKLEGRNRVVAASEL